MFVDDTSLFPIAKNNKLFQYNLNSHFNIHNENKTNKCNKIISGIKKISLCILPNSLLTIYKTFVLKHL